jgi:putative transposase
MPRANRFFQPGLIYHLTHRCHDGSHLFRFGRDRSEYCLRLRLALKEFGVSLLNYSITSNHTHLIATQSSDGSISRMMQKLEGDFAGYYNRRKHRTGAFWADRFHCTMVEDGKHLQNCLIYVDLNMVRASVVTHPSQWIWCGYLELIGEKKRCRLLHRKRLIQLLDYPDLATFQKAYCDQVQHAIEEKRLQREGFWTASIAVGCESYVKRIAAAIKGSRRKPIIDKGKNGAWTIRESMSVYRTHD